jgi:hypothetical protein
MPPMVDSAPATSIGHWLPNVLRRRAAVISWAAPVVAAQTPKTRHSTAPSAWAKCPTATAPWTPAGPVVILHGYVPPGHQPRYGKDYAVDALQKEGGMREVEEKNAASKNWQQT